MSTAKRLVLSLTGRNESQNGTGGESSTRLFSSSSPGHELDEIAVVSGADTGRISYGSLSLGATSGQPNGPRYVPGKYHRHKNREKVKHKAKDKRLSLLYNSMSNPTTHF